MIRSQPTVPSTRLPQSLVMFEDEYPTSIDSNELKCTLNNCGTITLIDRLALRLRQRK